jgi:hypothetical protein
MRKLKELIFEFYCSLLKATGWFLVSITADYGEDRFLGLVASFMVKCTDKLMRFLILSDRLLDETINLFYCFLLKAAFMSKTYFKVFILILFLGVYCSTVCFSIIFLFDVIFSDINWGFWQSGNVVELVKLMPEKEFDGDFKNVPENFQIESEKFKKNCTDNNASIYSGPVIYGALATCCLGICVALLWNY